MSLIRKDPFSSSWVIYSSKRNFRPNDYLNKKQKCPFCPNNEEETPPEIFSLKDKKGNWLIRVVPNKYPALKDDNFNEVYSNFIYKEIKGYGKHEVVIESPLHNTSFEEFSQKHLIDIFNVYSNRYKKLKKEKNIKYIMLFKNVGSNAGASLKHPHSQLLALPILPVTILNELKTAKSFYNKNKKCFFCEMLKEERKNKKRIIFENEDFVSLNPFFSKFYFETWIFPKKHFSDFENSQEVFPNLALILKKTIKALSNSLENLSYNLIIHTSPIENSKFFHWHIEILPKFSLMAGFEWGSGFYINTVYPEMASEYLRTGKKFLLNNKE